MCACTCKCARVFSLLVCYFIPDKNRMSQLASTPCQRKHTKGGARVTNQPPNNSDRFNLSPTNLPFDDFAPEKEVCEEKEEDREGRSWAEQSKECHWGAKGTTAQGETSSRVQTQSVKRGKASMPMREWDSFLYGVWSIHVLIADSIELRPGLHHHVDFLHER